MLDVFQQDATLDTRRGRNVAAYVTGEVLTLDETVQTPWQGEACLRSVASGKRVHVIKQE